MNKRKYITKARSGNSLPPGYIARRVDGVDIIGESISEFWAACPVAHRSLYSEDGTAFYDDATIIANIEASPYLNDGGELIGDSTKGYVQYPDGTAEAVLRKAYRWFGLAYIVSVIFGGEQVTFGGDSAVSF